MKELAALIRSDVAFSSEVLTMANSALFTFRTEITGILQATVLLGLQRVKAVALTVGMRSYLMASLKIPGVLAPQPGLRFGLRRTRRSLLDGARHGLPGRAHAYVGLTVVEPLQYSNLLLAAEESAVDILDEERKLFGMDHCQAGRWLTSPAGWRTPPASRQPGHRDR